MPRKASIRTDAQNLRREVSPGVRKTTRDDLVRVCSDAEKSTAGKAIEFVEKIAGTDTWTLDDWVELIALAGAGRLFHEVRLAFTEIDEVGAVAVSIDE